VWVALALLAVVESASPPRVDLVLTGAAGTPVSAAPRSLSDLARELREGRKAVGGFSAIRTTVPGSSRVAIPAFVREVPSDGSAAETEPEPVAQPAPEILTMVVPSGYGPVGRGGLRRRSLAFAAPGTGPRHAFRPSVLSPAPAHSGGRSRQRPG
jgi:hypothetical protein